jgi:hypothetical protein
MKMENAGATLPFHPTLVVLTIMLKEGTDFSKISRDHPKLHKHEFYQPHHKFPINISNLLPPNTEHWWESLSKQ